MGMGGETEEQAETKVFEWTEEDEEGARRRRREQREWAWGQTPGVEGDPVREELDRELRMGYGPWGPVQEREVR